MTFDVHQLDVFVLVGAVVTLAAILAVRLSAGVGLPSLLFYLFIGVLLGEAGPFGIQFDDAQLAHALGFGALAMILAEGGLTTDWRQMRSSVRLGTSLATVGVAVSVAVVAVGAHYLLGLPWELAVLLGAICSPTDAAAVFSVLRALPLPKRLTGALEAESGLNDAPTVVLVGIISTGAVGESGLLETGGIIVFELIAGGLVGAACGFAGAWVMRRVALPSSGLYPLAVLCLAFTAYGASSALHASGFAAIYVAALILGNSELPHRVATRSFAEGIAWLAQIGLFVMLGLLLSPSRIDLDTVVQALVTGLVLTLVARPLSVLVSSVVQPMGPRDLAFISWAGLRGAVPIVLATIPLSEGVEGADDLFDIVFVMVVVYTLLTGPTLPWVARRLRVARARRGGRAARQGGRRPPPGDDRAHVEDARRRGRGAAAAPGGVGLAGDPLRRGSGPGAAYGPAPRRRPGGGHAPQAARGHRGPDAAGLGERAPRPVARRPVAPRPRPRLTRTGAPRAGGAGWAARVTPSRWPGSRWRRPWRRRTRPASCAAPGSSRRPPRRCPGPGRRPARPRPS
jgi:cell volume regulation protein A